MLNTAFEITESFEDATSAQIWRGFAHQRKVIHIDQDAFYASVEQRDNPDYRGRPLAVGSPRERGVVAAASYEARRFGVRSAMPSVTALRKCPELIFAKPRFDVYRSISLQIRAIFAEYTPLIEPLSLDEAYLDVTDNLKGIPSATQIAEQIRARIFKETRLTASAGISTGKWLSKMASDVNKPNGQFVITPSMAPEFVASLEIGRFHGVGPATESKMRRLGISTGRDLRSKSLDFLIQHFGKSGPFFYDIARGIDNRPVQPNRIRKSVGAENTFLTDLFLYEDLAPQLDPILDKVWAFCERNGTRGRTVTLKVKYADFEQITRAKSFQRAIDSRDTLGTAAIGLLRALFPMAKGVRLLGVSLSSLGGGDEPSESPQLKLEL